MLRNNKTVDYSYRKSLKSLSPHMQELFKNQKDMNDFLDSIQSLLSKSRKRFRRGDSNLCLGVILTQLKIWEPNDRKFILDLYNFSDIDEDCYDYKRALAIAKKIRSLEEFKRLYRMLNK